MKRFVSAVVAFFLFCVLVFAPSPAQAAECYLEPLGESNNFRVVCTGLTAGEIESGIVSGEVYVITPTATATVTLPPLPYETVTETPPPVTITDIVKVPGPTSTVTLPGPTSTATIRLPGDESTIFLPGPTRTVSGPVVTKTAEATPQPTVTDTQTVVVTEVPQTETEIDTPNDSNVLFDPPPLTVVDAVGYSVLALLTLCGLIILGLWLGYVLGYKDSERKEMKFLDALRDQFYYKGNHR